MYIERGNGYISGGKKLLNICILEILMKYTDADHRMDQKDIVRKLKEDYGMEVDRKSVKANLMSLVDFGFDIEYQETERKRSSGETEMLTSGWYYNHAFDKTELRMLIDSVLFSRTIPASQSQTLIDKITSLSNIYFKNTVKHVCNLPELEHTDNKQTMLNVEVIDEAIGNNKKIAFLYHKYGTDKKLHPRKPEKYIASPYQMVANNGKYYLVCNHDKYDTLANYRIDRMTEVEILKEPAKDKKLVKGMEYGLNLPKHLAEHIYMFSDDPEMIILKTGPDAMGDFVDWFGKSFDLLSGEFVRKNYGYPADCGGDTVYVKVNCSPMAMFHWAMQYGTTVEVIYPEKLRADIREAVRKMLAAYEQ